MNKYFIKIWPATWSGNRLFLALSASLLVLPGCQVSHSNLTPDELPYHPPSGQDALNRIKTNAQMDSVKAGDHALWLDVGTKLFTRRNSIEAFVVMGGNEIPMSEIDASRIIYEYDVPLCDGSVDYRFRTRNTSVFGSRVYQKTTGPYTATVPQASAWAWWSPINSGPTDDNWTLNLVGQERQTVIVRNYNSTSLTVLSLTITQPGIRGFTISSAPSMPKSLFCGDSTTFEVRWNEDPTVRNDLGTLQMQFAIGGNVQSRVISLQAVPGPG